MGEGYDRGTVKFNELITITINIVLASNVAISTRRKKKAKIYKPRKTEQFTRRELVNFGRFAFV